MSVASITLIYIYIYIYIYMRGLLKPTKKTWKFKLRKVQFFIWTKIPFYHYSNQCKIRINIVNLTQFWIFNKNMTIIVSKIFGNFTVPWFFFLRIHDQTCSMLNSFFLKTIFFMFISNWFFFFFWKIK